MADPAQEPGHLSLLIFGSVVTFIEIPFSPSRWWVLVLTLIELCLLLSPPTWRFIWRDRPDAVRPPPAIADPRTFTDVDRADGWYADPDDPKRMRYWSNASGEWLGKTKTPRKVRKSWRAEGSS